MKQSEQLFGELLTEAIREISKYESKSMAIVQDELGHAIGKKGKSSIEKWRVGARPSKSNDVAGLAREIMKRIRKDRGWLETFCDAGGYPNSTSLLDELLPIPQIPTDHIPDVGPLPAGSHMPLRRNDFFVGRGWDLQALAQALHSEQVAAVNQIQVAAATGMGGMGKTQLACEFVHRYGQFFPGGVFWINFEEADAVPAKIAECGGVGRLDLTPAYSELSQEQQVILVENEWRKPTLRLLVFDNCEDERLLHRWIPKTGGCRVLVTSRRQVWDRALRVHTHSLGVLYPHESVNLLVQLSEINEPTILEQLADEVGHLPLALHLAGKYLFQYKRFTNPTEYLSELQNPHLLEHPSFTKSGISPTGHSHHVWKTFALSYEKLLSGNKKDEIARELMINASHFAPGEPIWSDLLVRTLSGFEDNARWRFRSQEAYLRLLELGLIEVGSHNIYRLHRLIALFVQSMESERVAASIEAIEDVVFEETTRINAEGFPLPLLAKQLHLRSVTDLAKAREDKRGARLCQVMGEHLRQTGDFKSAIDYFSKALTIWDSMSDASPTDLAYCHHKLGQIRREQNDLELAEPLLETAWLERVAIFGPAHPEVAASLNELGRLFYQKGEFKSAIKKFQHAVDICRSTVGATNHLTAEYLNNLGMARCASGQLEEAQRELEQALSIRKTELGERHRQTALSYNNVGYILRELGDYPAAHIQYERALSIRESILGETHPETGQSHLNMADILLAQDRLADVSKHANKAITSIESSFSPTHPWLIHPLQTLGNYWLRLAKPAQAKIHLERALQLARKSYQADHRIIIHLTKALDRIDEELQGQ